MLAVLHRPHLLQSIKITPNQFCVDRERHYIADEN